MIMIIIMIMMIILIMIIITIMIKPNLKQTKREDKEHVARDEQQEQDPSN